MPSKQKQVVEEIKRRAAAGHSLKSGDNRGDWLYAAAVKYFGSWGKAVQAAGFSYAKIKTCPLTKTEVKRELRKLVKTGEPVLAKDHPELSRAAVRHLGSWWDALAAVGDKNPAATKWTKANVLAEIHRDIEAGLPVTSNEMRRRNENLYAAGRRRFGSWAAAVTAAKLQKHKRPPDNRVGPFVENSIYKGDSLALIRYLPDESVQCIITSPPYWRKRDYHADGQIGLEKNPLDYVHNLTRFFADTRRVLRSDGVLWVVLGDGYFGTHVIREKGAKVLGKDQVYRPCVNHARWKGIPDKQLVGMPWRLAFALQEDGWFLRVSVIWHKPHASPEPTAKDRPSRTHENVFLFSKSPRYFFVKKEPFGSVWTVKIANNARGRLGHYAAFPEALIEPMVRSSSREGDLVLDPFIGTGTTGTMAARMGRRWLGFDISPLSPDYKELHGGT